MLIPKESSLSSCPTLNLCVPEDPQGTGKAFGLGEEMQAPNRPTECAPPAPMAALASFPAHLGPLVSRVPAELLSRLRLLLLLHLDSSGSSEGPSPSLLLPAPCLHPRGLTMVCGLQFAVKCRQCACLVCSVPVRTVSFLRAGTGGDVMGAHSFRFWE